jgi:predicted  nucleic acid-binding Zn-ribbon protein
MSTDNIPQLSGTLEVTVSKGRGNTWNALTKHGPIEVSFFGANTSLIAAILFGGVWKQIIGQAVDEMIAEEARRIGESGSAAEASKNGDSTSSIASYSAVSALNDAASNLQVKSEDNSEAKALEAERKAAELQSRLKRYQAELDDQMEMLSELRDHMSQTRKKMVLLGHEEQDLREQSEALVAERQAMSAKLEEILRASQEGLDTQATLKLEAIRDTLERSANELTRCVAQVNDRIEEISAMKKKMVQMASELEAELEDVQARVEVLQTEVVSTEMQLRSLKSTSSAPKPLIKASHSTSAELAAVAALEKAKKAEDEKCAEDHARMDEMRRADAKKAADVKRAMEEDRRRADEMKRRDEETYLDARLRAERQRAKEEDDMAEMKRTEEEAYLAAVLAAQQRAAQDMAEMKLAHEEAFLAMRLDAERQRRAEEEDLAEMKRAEEEAYLAARRRAEKQRAEEEDLAEHALLLSKKIAEEEERKRAEDESRQYEAQRSLKLRAEEKELELMKVTQAAMAEMLRQQEERALRELTELRLQLVAIAGRDDQARLEAEVRDRNAKLEREAQEH